MEEGDEVELDFDFDEDDFDEPDNIYEDEPLDDEDLLQGGENEGDIQSE